jgi:hypothetical protein
MRSYQGQHRFYCGIDIHARTLALCVRDAADPLASLGAGRSSRASRVEAPGCRVKVGLSGKCLTGAAAVLPYADRARRRGGNRLRSGRTMRTLAC